MDDLQLDDRDLARMLSLGRTVIGAFAFLAPHRFAAMWTGEDAGAAATGVAMRGLGARDVALGLGTLMALEGDGPVRRWLEAQALADASDAASTLMSMNRLRGFRRWVSLATAGTSCYLAVRLSNSLD
ncbi:MAG TPA: hypothetical protein VFS18_01440 [Actinomycetota bacterium]|nr:hypothetical protein [Actinomycetota bacterium]